MNIAGDAQALVGDRKTRDLGARGAQFDDGCDEAAKREHRETERDGEECDESDVAPSVADEPAGDDRENPEHDQDGDEPPPAQRPPGGHTAVDEHSRPLSPEDE